MSLKRPRIATLEAFIIDTFTTVDKDGNEKPLDKPDQIGGAGTYAIVGARIFLPPARLGMIVDYTPETLPAPMVSTLEAFGKDMWAFRQRKDGHGTTRAVNRYRGQVRGFEYLTQPYLLSPRDLLDTEWTAPLPSWIHLVSYPDRAVQAIAEIAAMSGETDGGWHPGFLWEPEPPCCVPENLGLIAKKIAQHVDVISPNDTEAIALYGIDPPTEPEKVLALEYCTRRLLALRPRVAAVLRAGPLGCCYALAEDLPAEAHVDPLSPHAPQVPVYWVQPFWVKGMAGWDKAVVDPTGAGNAFMGGLMAALDEGKDMHEGGLRGGSFCSFSSGHLGHGRSKLCHRAARPAIHHQGAGTGGVERRLPMGAGRGVATAHQHGAVSD
ncbi:hypothetical protein VHUM_00920 [Vanrija humicola]|uniref:Carbohydrate kinase PfkB domain-containing protein n=1 Tax=Vanrija humicola TaxID=5417 RepID=A0A7D8Z6S1_VANHU|nr:hypothetical protein VHUM_00920 [Vanrija humicola]